MLPFNKKLKPLARKLRKEMTEAEKFFWGEVRKKQLKGYQFYRQKNIGSYIVDFYCPGARLVIELDGGQHYLPEGQEKDKIRDAYLNRIGFTVLRFSDREVLTNIEGVLEHILEHLKIPPNPPLEKGGIKR